MPPTRESPAAKAGLRSGDEITSFNGVSVTGEDQLAALIRGNDDGRDGDRLPARRYNGRVTTTTSTTVQLVQQSVDRGQRGSSVQAHGFLGVELSTRRIVKGGPIYTLGQMGVTAEQTVTAMVHLPVRVWGVAQAIVGGEKPRSPDSPVSIVGGGRIAGETASKRSANSRRPPR